MKQAKAAPSSTISLIAAVDEGGLIGRGGGLPWRLPNDLQHFKELTIRKTILMGRRTWDSLGRPLPQRENWVVSRSGAFQPEGARVFASVADALAAHHEGELMVIGGAEIYRQTLPVARRLYLTRVHAHLQGDVYFPAFDELGFKEQSRDTHPADDRHAYAYSFIVLERR
ncbi:MAG TPA: dihydrofolate reductase [Nevskiaceae bacterium]|nr:dihydrofolate reductase [Nevskiaceae bacterium]